MWHPGLERFGAAQLNDRFRATAGGPMTSPAWAGWMAVKVIWEAFLRSPQKSPPGLSAFFVADTTAFDGHKGMPLSFRRWDHQLRQPLYAVVPGVESVTEVPAPAKDDMSMRDLLDTIGDRDPGSACDD
jgi:ABC transporter substrate binding protein (PQQ-dependent alcohol dehydrogenase system)